MARVKNPSTNTALAATPETSTELTAWDAELAKYAAEGAAKELVTSSYFSLKSGQLSLGKNPIKGNAMQVVVLGSAVEYAYYEGEYDPEIASSPSCFAVATEEKDIAPHPDVVTKQSDVCKTCAKNQYGSADKGKGKACSNRRRLALIPADALGNIGEAQLAMLRVPVTSVKSWATYVQQLATNLKRPTFAVITEISVVPDPKTQFRVQFTLIKSITDSATLSALLARFKESTPTLLQPFSPAEAAPVAKVGPKKKAKY